MTPGPLVDVIVPTRNRERLTREAIASVRRQTHGDWRLLVVDDASDDGSVDVLAAEAATDARVEVVRRTRRGGAQTARQTGLEASTAPFVAILDSDDLWAPTKLARQLDAYQRHSGDLPGLGAVLCGHRWLDADGHQRGGPRVPIVHGRANPLASDNMSTILLRRDALLAAGGFLPRGQVSRAGANHIDLYLRLTRTCAFTTVPEVLVTCRAHDGTRDSDVLASRTGADVLAGLLERHAEHLADFPADRAQLLARTGARYLAVGDRGRGLHYLRRALAGAGPASAGRIVRRYAGFTARALVRPPRPAAPPGPGPVTGVAPVRPDGGSR